MTKTRSELTNEMQAARTRTGRKRLERTTAQAWELRQVRNGRSVGEPTERPRTVLIPLGVSHEDLADRAARKAHPRRTNWDDCSPDRTSRTVTVSTVSHGRYSSRCTFERLTYSPRIRSCGACSPNRLLVRHADESKTIRAPRGWRFGSDDIGLYVVRQRETRQAYRYHFVSTDLISVTVLRTAALDHESVQRSRAMAKTREERQHQELVSKAREIGIWVSMQDSVSAGNCAGGTRTWAQQHSLSVNQRYPISVLDRFAKDQRVRRVIDSAERRAVNELKQGYCGV